MDRRQILFGGVAPIQRRPRTKDPDKIGDILAGVAGQATFVFAHCWTRFRRLSGVVAGGVGGRRRRQTYDARGHHSFA
jgi:hypothetical protein